MLVEIKFCGFCHTDIHAIDGDWSTKPNLPLCPGHEGVGYIAEVIAPSDYPFCVAVFF